MIVVIQDFTTILTGLYQTVLGPILVVSLIFYFSLQLLWKEGSNLFAYLNPGSIHFPSYPPEDFNSIITMRCSFKDSVIQFICTFFCLCCVLNHTFHLSEVCTASALTMYVLLHGLIFKMGQTNLNLLLKYLQAVRLYYSQNS